MGGPVATVALNAPSAVEDADARLSLRWRNCRRSLHEAGFPSAELEQLDEVVARLDHGEGPALALVHAAGHETFVEFLDAPIGRDLAVVDSLAHVGSVLENRQQSLPHLMVVADRVGADLIGFGAGSEAVAAAVEGDTEHIHRGHPGGWSQRRFQQRAENQWESNAKECAEEVAVLARRLRARVVTIAGDVRAVGFLVEHLPSDVAELVVVLDGQSPDLIAEETVRAVADLVARDTRSILERFGEQHGKGRAAVGPHATLDALSAGRVEALLVHDDPTDDRRARFRHADLWCTFDLAQDAPPGAGDDEPEDGRLIDVAIRSALLGDATVRFVPEHGLPDGRLAALLRW